MIDKQTSYVISEILKCFEEASKRLWETAAKEVEEESKLMYSDFEKEINDK